MGYLRGDDGAVSHHGVWKAQKTLIPTHKQGNPMALRNESGQIITSQEGIKKLCLEEILQRVRHRKIHPELKELQQMKEILCEKRLNLVKHIKSDIWTMNQLDKVLCSLKKKKCCDPQGYINELFQHDSLGYNLKQSLLTMLNKTKDFLEIPDMMVNVNVVMIPKPGKPNQNDIKNQRGIFLISVFRSILMKMLLQDEYKKIDEYMSDSNAGGRKGRRAQDHLFIINGIIFDHAR